MKRVRFRFAHFAFPLLFAGLTAAQLSGRPVETADGRSVAPFPLNARSAILIDQTTGRVLFEYNADQPLAPASLAKLMSLHIVYEKLEDRSINRSDVVSITSNAWANNQAPGSSLMDLGPGQIVTVEELMRGMAVASGNDAATALAEYTAGSTEKFVRLMNEEARFMGYSVTRFTDPSGYGPGNRTTAREFADFCRRYICAHPQSMEELHSLREFEYPLRQNMADARRATPYRTKRQFNPNYLVWDDFGVDGLKTGHLDNNNFTAAITARRGAMRLIAVLLGVPGRSLVDGSRRRAEDGMNLLSYGYRNYTTIELDPPVLPPVRVWEGSQRDLAIAAARPIYVTARRSEMEKLAYAMDVRVPLVAPVVQGQRVGSLVYSAGNRDVALVPLVAASAIERGGLVRSALDSAFLSLSAVFGGSAASLRSTFDTVPPQALLSAGSAADPERRTP
ncbi:MAG TPA: D-alanyl-D-alanine carboxypeptidase family protein [Spirochaetia bacterium]|nr:D-alanyl-D-alanine carboxypeptidase family protein [Spirochaetia bacterium]